MTARTFAVEIAQRLGEVLPPEFKVWAEDESVCFAPVGQAHSRVSVALVEAVGYPHPSSVFEIVARNVLDSVQDRITLTTTEPWPPQTGADGSYLAMPFARLDRLNLTMGYGTLEKPAVLLRPLEVS